MEKLVHHHLIYQAKVFIDSFWQASKQKILFINRESGKDFTVDKIM